jgi:hypothetical protein
LLSERLHLEHLSGYEKKKENICCEQLLLSLRVEKEMWQLLRGLDFSNGHARRRLSGGLCRDSNHRRGLAGQLTAKLRTRFVALEF